MRLRLLPVGISVVSLHFFGRLFFLTAATDAFALPPTTTVSVWTVLCSSPVHPPRAA